MEDVVWTSRILRHGLKDISDVDLPNPLFCVRVVELVGNVLVPLCRISRSPAAGRKVHELDGATIVENGRACLQGEKQRFLETLLRWRWPSWRRGTGHVSHEKNSSDHDIQGQGELRVVAD